MTDLRYALRALAREPWFAGVAILTFGLGIGVTIAAFSVIDRVLFRPLPYGHPETIVMLRECGAAGCNGAFPSRLALEARNRSASFADIAVAAMPGSYSASKTPGDEPPLRMSGVSANLLRVLQVQPVIGRDFSDEDARAGRGVAVLSYETWQRRFGGSREALGREVWSGGSAITIVGVLPPGFMPPTWTAPDPRWDGLALDHAGWAAIGTQGSVAAPVARLRAGITPAAAQAELSATAAALGSELRRPGARPTIVRVDPVQSALFSRFRSSFWLVFAASVLLLLLACANLATLLVARGQSREPHAAIAAALGASSWRIVRTAILESTIVCMAGAGVALMVLAVAGRALLSVLPPLFARYAAGAADGRVIGVALAAAAVCAAIAGLLPALRATRVDMLRVLQRAGAARRRRMRGGNLLLALETALGVVLSVGALLVLVSFARLGGEDLGFVPADLYQISARIPRVPPDVSLANYRQLLDVLRTVPGVRAVGGSDSVVASGTGAMRGFSSDRSMKGGRYEASAGYFDTLATPFVAGRAFTDAEVEQHAAVAILNASGLAQVWPDVRPGDAVGRVLTLPGEPARLIVGIVPDLKNHYGEDRSPALFVPLGDHPAMYGTAVVRMARGAVPRLADLRTRIGERIGAATIAIRPVGPGLDEWLENPRFRAVLFGVLAAAALLLAAIGLYAVTSVGVRERQFELGVRMSLGATGGDIRRMVVRQACAPVVAGTAFGVVAAYWAEQFIREFLYEVQGRDPRAYAIVAALLLATAALAAWLPARRAGRVDPAVVLRAQ